MERDGVAAWEPTRTLASPACFFLNCSVILKTRHFVNLQGWSEPVFSVNVNTTNEDVKRAKWAYFFRKYRSWPEGMSLTACLTCLYACIEQHCPKTAETHLMQAQSYSGKAAISMK